MERLNLKMYSQKLVTITLAIMSLPIFVTISVAFAKNSGAGVYKNINAESMKLDRSPNGAIFK
jgi:hypothetical protein